MRRALVIVVAVAFLSVAICEQVKASSTTVEFEIVKSRVSGTFSVRGDIGNDITVEPGERIDLTVTVSDSQTTLSLDLSPYGSYSETFDTPMSGSISIPIVPVIPGVSGINLKVSGDLEGRLEFTGASLPPSDLEWDDAKSIFLTYDDYDFEHGTDITVRLDFSYTVDVGVVVDLPWPLPDFEVISVEAFAIDGSPTLQKTIHVRSPDSSADYLLFLAAPIIAGPVIAGLLFFLRRRRLGQQ